MRRFSRFAFLALLAGALFLLPGCGQDEPAKTPGADTSQQAAQAAARTAAPAQRNKLYLDFAGGPTGGTFNFFANKISSIATHAFDYLDVAAKGTGGSAENLRLLDHGDVDLGIVYAGDAWLGRKGLLVNDANTYENVRALAYLYGAPAQLVVRADSGIENVSQLEGKIVAVGNPGSGAALSAERFFSALGMWDAIEHRNLGYSQAAADFSESRIDAFWVLAGYPNSSVIEAASRVPVRLLPLAEVAERSGFFAALPFYTPTAIPAGTYEGQGEEVMTFQDSALLCASATTSREAVIDTLEAVFSPKGTQELIGAHKAARGMGVSTGLEGISIPLHQGAVTFWEGRGLAVPDSLK